MNKKMNRRKEKKKNRVISRNACHNRVTKIGSPRNRTTPQQEVREVVEIKEAKAYPGGIHLNHVKTP
jgi:hypothetical protein